MVFAGQDVPGSDPNELPPTVLIPPNYLNIDVCTDIDGGNGRFVPGSFAVTGVKIGRGYDWVGGGPPNHHHEYWHTVIVDYKVTCGNRITYSGVKHLTSSRWICWESREGWPGYPSSCDEGTIAPTSRDVSVFNMNTGEIENWDNEVFFPFASVLGAWNGHKVSVPTYFGGKNKLAVPVILVNGLGFDYTSWGVIPAGQRGSDEWNSGLVSEYETGGLPDVMSKAYGLSKGTQINNNGIYFLNLDASIIAQDQDAVINAFMSRLSNMMLNHVTLAANFTPEFKADIVCHSTGCLLVRKAIEMASQYQSPIPGFNPVNYIGKIVMVDAPHEGTGLVKPFRDLVGDPQYGGLVRLMSHVVSAGWDNQGNEKEKPIGQDKLLETTVELDYSSIMYEEADGVFESAWAWLDGQMVDIVSTIAGIFGYGFDTFHVDVTGGFFGPHTVTVGADENLQDLYHTTVSPITAIGTQIDYAKDQLALIQESWLGTNPGGYPQKPNGDYIELFTFYSDDVGGIEKELVSKLADGVFENLCGSYPSSECFNIEKMASRTLTTKIEQFIETEDVSVGIEPWLGALLLELRSGWLRHSDLFVEKSSQVWGLENGGQDDAGNEIDKLHRAMPYNIHLSEIPVGHPSRPVIHGALSKLGSGNGANILNEFQFAKSGSTLMGRDLFCALEAGCGELLAQGADVVYLGPAVRMANPFPLPPGGIPTLPWLQFITTQSQDFTGEFALWLQNLSEQYSGVMLQTILGENLFGIIYDENVGTVMWKASDPSNSVVLAPPDRRPQFEVFHVGSMDEGSQLIIAVVIQGKRTLYRYSIENIGQIRVAAIGDNLLTDNALLIGNGALSNPSSQELAVAQYGDVKVILQEKGGSSTVQSSPWLWVINSTNQNLSGLTLNYYFNADPSRNPTAELDYPTGISYQVVQIEGNLWKVEVQLPEVPAHGSLPFQSGFQFRLHYGDWSRWITQDDYSFGSSMAFTSEKVVLKDVHGRIIWGVEPRIDDYRSIDIQQNDPISLNLQFMDGGIHENNMIRPRITLSHQGGSKLGEGYRIILYLPNVGGENVLPLLEDWWSPNCEGIISAFGKSGIQVSWSFGSSLSQGQEISIGEWGVHWSDYRAISKMGLHPLQIAVVDAQNNVVFGAIPSLPPEENDTPPIVTAITTDFTDAGIHEANMIRPQITLVNHGAEVLERGYTMSLYLKGFSSLPILDKWYSAEYTGEVNLQDNGWLRVDFTYTGFGITAESQISLGEWGIHLDSYLPIDKSHMNESVVVIHDVYGRLISGAIPQ